jgi:hypothetical protein
MQTIYVQLVDEGTSVYRPTEAERGGENIFKLMPTPDYDPEIEKWEYPPGSIVECNWQHLNGESVLVAVRQHVLLRG